MNESPDYKTFKQDGQCWCSDTRTMMQMRLEGHEKKCVIAREGWALNYQHMHSLDRQRAEDEAVGRAIRLGGAPK